MYPYMLHSPAVPVSHIAQPGEKIEIIKSEWPIRIESIDQWEESILPSGAVHSVSHSICRVRMFHLAALEPEARLTFKNVIKMS